MGMSVSCLGADGLDERFDALFMRSMSFSGDTAKSSTIRSTTFNGRDSEPTVFKSFGSGKLFIEGSLSFEVREMETKISIESRDNGKEKSQAIPKSRFSQLKESIPDSPTAQASDSKDAAALRLQKVYKSFRTRRQLADCAVLVEQHWWKLLDFAMLKRSSVSFFDITKPESAVSRWSRARLRAAKVGKGLSKDEKARKLALQHWLEAIDPRHRYGHNLHFYYNCWLKCESKQPFFYWLDVGEGKEVTIEEQCPRSKLQQQCIKYLGPKEREAYEVVLEAGMFFYKRDKKLLDTSGGPKDTKWIFVLSTTKKLYVGQKKKGLFQHSSFLAGGATSAAGRLVVEDGILKAVWPHSGHYRPTQENFQDFMSFLKEKNVDLSDVKESPTEGEEESYTKPRSNVGLKSSISEQNLATMNVAGKHGVEVKTSRISHGIIGNIAIPKHTTSVTAELNEGRRAESLPNLEQFQKKQFQMTSREESEEEEEETDGMPQSTTRTNMINSLVRSLGQRYCSSPDLLLVGKEAEEESAPEQPYIFRKENLFEEEHEEDGGASVPRELILRRINSKKGMKSLQLGNQLSCKWTTGAGPRIGIVRDYPWELQFRALEQVNLSPKSAGPSRFYASPRSSTMHALSTLESSLLEEMQQQQQQKPSSDREIETAP